MKFTIPLFYFNLKTFVCSVDNFPPQKIQFIYFTGWDCSGFVQSSFPELERKEIYHQRFHLKIKIAKINAAECTWHWRNVKDNRVIKGKSRSHSRVRKKEKGEIKIFGIIITTRCKRIQEWFISQQFISINFVWIFDLLQLFGVDIHFDTT